MSSPITEPGWYRASPRGLQLVASLNEPPDDTTDLVKVEIDGHTTQEPMF